MTQNTDRPAYLDAVTLLRRSKSGDTIHRAECPRAKPGRTVPWLWAEDKTRADLAAATWLHLCKVCDPLGALPESAEASQ